MVGLVISDSFLLVGEWDSSLDYLSLKGVSKIDYSEPITQSIFNESSFLVFVIDNKKNSLPVI